MVYASDISKSNKRLITVIEATFYTPAEPPVALPAFYVSPGGSDSADGLSPETAWQTIAKVNAADINPGGQVLFERGGIWRESLVLSQDGQGNSRIIISSYGAGDIPIISGANVIAGLSSGADPREWSAALTTEPTQVFVDDERGERVATVGELDTFRQWHWASNVLTVYGDVDESEPVVEATVRATGVEITGDFLTFSSIQIERAIRCVTCHTANNLILSGLTVRDAFVQNIHGVGLVDHDGGHISGCTISGAGADGILISGTAKDWHITNNEVTENCRLHDELVGGDFQQEFSGAIKFWANNVNNHVNGLVIQFNHVHNNGPHSFVVGNANDIGRSVGIWLDEIKGPSVDNVVRYNTVHNNASFGIYLEKCQDAHAYYNLIYDNASVTSSANLGIHATSGVAAFECSAYNNVIAGTAFWSVLFGGSASSFTDCEFKNNIIRPDASSNAHIRLDDTGGDIGSGNIINNNFYDTTADVFRVNGDSATFATTYTTLAAWQAASGQDASSGSGDSLMTDPANKIFTLQVGSPASPCIDAGASVGLARDFQGAVVPQGAAPDIGAYEAA